MGLPLASAGNEYRQQEAQGLREPVTAEINTSARLKMPGMRRLSSDKIFSCHSFFFKPLQKHRLVRLINDSERAGGGEGYNSQCDLLSNLMFPNNGEEKSIARLFAVFQLHSSSLSHWLQQTQLTWEQRDLRCRKQLRVASWKNLICFNNCASHSLSKSRRTSMENCILIVLLFNLYDFQCLFTPGWPTLLTRCIKWRGWVICVHPVVSPVLPWNTRAYHPCTLAILLHGI